MELLLYYAKRKQLIKKIISIIPLIIILVILGLLSGCSKGQKNYLFQTMTLSDTILNTTSEATLIRTKTPTLIWPTQILMAPTKTMDPLYDLAITLNVTQGPVSVSTITPEETKYLYKDAIVTIRLVDQFDAIAYLNLDNLTDNEINNSDIEIERTIGNEAIYSLDPVNNSYYYYSGEGTINFDSCLKHFPISGLTNVEYILQGEIFKNGGLFCVLTNERRVAVVSYVEDSIKIIDNFIEELSVRITVYNKIIQ